MKKVTGGALPALAWHEFMVAAHEGGAWWRRCRRTWHSGDGGGIADRTPPCRKRPYGRSACRRKRVESARLRGTAAVRRAAPG